MSIINCRMSTFDLEKSVARARKRLRSSPGRRSDRGASRLDPGVLECVARVLSGQERPPVKTMREDLAALCRRRGLSPPSRATLYKLMSTLPGPVFGMRELPPGVQQALYNLGPESRVPGHQVAFYCFNHGDLEAVCYAAGLPWLAIYQALRTPGWHERSRGLAEAVALARGISDGRS